MISFFVVVIFDLVLTIILIFKPLSLTTECWYWSYNLARDFLDRRLALKRYSIQSKSFIYMHGRQALSKNNTPFRVLLTFWMASSRHILLLMWWGWRCLQWKEWCRENFSLQKEILDYSHKTPVPVSVVWLALLSKTKDIGTYCRQSVWKGCWLHSPQDSPPCSCRCHHLPLTPDLLSRASCLETMRIWSRCSEAFHLWTTHMWAWFHFHGSSSGPHFHWAPGWMKTLCECRALIWVLEICERTHNAC